MAWPPITWQGSVGPGTKKVNEAGKEAEKTLDHLKLRAKSDAADKDPQVSNARRG